MIFISSPANTSSRSMLTTNKIQFLVSSLVLLLSSLIVMLSFTPNVDGHSIHNSKIMNLRPQQQLETDDSITPRDTSYTAAFMVSTLKQTIIHHNDDNPTTEDNHDHFQNNLKYLKHDLLSYVASLSRDYNDLENDLMTLDIPSDDLFASWILKKLQSSFPNLVHDQFCQSIVSTTAKTNISSRKTNTPLTNSRHLSNNNNNQQRQDEEENYEEEEEEELDVQEIIFNALLAFICVCTAALAAGLTMGLLSLEVLDLKIKELASNSQEVRDQARNIMPLIQDHHRLLVTLLLMNALANEALPIFLDKIVPGYIAVLMSVTLVLFFGEIIPSAIFTGPNQLAIASKLAPLVKILFAIMYPIANPIARLLDKVLHHDDHHTEGGEIGGSLLQKYDNAEIAALVRIQFEERMANKKLRKTMIDNMTKKHGLNDSSVNNNSVNSSVHNNSLRFIRHIDTVNMVEGALNFHVKVVQDIMVKIKRVSALPNDLVLNEDNILHIYRLGHSRIPVYVHNKDDETDDQTRICGLMMTRQLIVVNSNENRLLSTLPLTIPHCVHPSMNLVDLTNLLQHSNGHGCGRGHMAIVCVNPDMALKALGKNEPIPKEACVIGIVTLEDCLEELIQEEIYDEYDSKEKKEHDLALKVYKKWRAFVHKKRQALQRKSTSKKDEEEPNELTSLVANSDHVKQYENNSLPV